MKRKSFLSSGEWVAYFYENAQTAAAMVRPPATMNLPADLAATVAASLPAWQLGETSDGRHLRAAAKQYADAHDDPAFLSAVDLFIREEQRHGSALGDWLDRVGIPRKKWDLGDTLFRLCRYAFPVYAIWASVVVMVESMAEIYYAAVRRLVSCPRLRTECDRILRDEVRHIQFQCEHLASTRRTLPPWARGILIAAEAGFYLVVCTAVWLAHGRLLRMAGLPFAAFARAALRKFLFMQRLMNPARYDFNPQVSRALFFPIRIRD